MAEALLLDDDTVRSWHRLYESDGISGLTTFAVGDSQSRLSVEQEGELFEWSL